MAIGLNKWLMMFFLGFFLLVNSAMVGKTAHPLHISTVEIVHNATDKTLEITCKTFWDDFETILGKYSNTKVDLANEKNTSQNNQKVFDYLRGHLKIVVDGKPVSLSFVGFEKEDVVIYSYLQADNVSSVKKVTVTNSIMQDMFDDQAEIIHVVVNGNRKSTKLDYPDKEASFDF